MTAQIGKCKIPATNFGFGTAPLGNMFAKVTEQDAWTTMQAVWDAGFRVFDTAPFYGYGLAEHRLGDFLRTKPRDEYLLSTKVGRMLVPRCGKEPLDTFFQSDYPFDPVYDYTYDAAMRSFEDSLQRLGLDQIDILLIHDVDQHTHGDKQPEVFQTAMDGAALALKKLRDEGVVGAIGMGLNNWEPQQKALESFDFDTFLLAGRYTLLEQEAAKTFLPLCVERNVKILIGSVFNSGLLVAQDFDNATWNYQPAPKAQIDHAKALNEVCKAHDVDLAAAALQFASAHPAVGTVLVGARSKSEVEDAAKWSNQEIPTAMWEELIEKQLIPQDAPVPSN